MSREVIPFSASDISALAKSLREQLSQCDHAPGHVEMLNMLARGVGHRNFQSLRADAEARARLDRVATPVSAPLESRASGAGAAMLRWTGSTGGVAIEDEPAGAVSVGAVVADGAASGVERDRSERMASGAPHIFRPRTAASRDVRSKAAGADGRPVACIVVWNNARRPTRRS